MCNITIPVANKDYEFYNVPDNVAKAIVTLLQECESCESKIVLVESER